MLRTSSSNPSLLLCFPTKTALQRTSTTISSTPVYKNTTPKAGKLSDSTILRDCPCLLLFALFAAFLATCFDCFLDIAEGVFSYHAFTQRMGIASSRTTDTGVFIKPTAETGWERDITLAKKEKRSSPLVELDVCFFLISELVFLALFIFSYFLLFKDTSIGSHQPSAQSYHKQLLLYQTYRFLPRTLTHGPFSFKFPIYQPAFRVSKSKAWPLSSYTLLLQTRIHPSSSDTRPNPQCSEMAPHTCDEREGNGASEPG